MYNLNMEKSADYFGTFLQEMDKSQRPEELTDEEIVSLLSADDLLYLANQDTAKTYQELALKELDKRTTTQEV